MKSVKRAMPPNSKIERANGRPLRGSPEQTRDRLIAAAAIQFNGFGFHGTDTNAIAKEAGYATGTFYKHFRDKREIFLASYDRWLEAQWKQISEELSSMQESRETARRIVKLSIRYHTEWKGLRASLMELVFSDAEARKFFRMQRRKQLDLIAELRSRYSLPARTREQDAVHLYMTERIFDAVGQGEIQALGLDLGVIIEFVVERVQALLEPVPGESQS